MSFDPLRQSERPHLRCERSASLRDAPFKVGSVRSAFLAPAAVLVVGACLLGACPGSLENKEQFLGAGGGCGDVASGLVAQRCATAACHDADAPAGSLDLTDDAGLAGRLVDKDSVGCAGGKLVDSQSPEASVLYTKCLESNACATRMPQTGEKLTAAEEACLLEWIQTL